MNEAMDILESGSARKRRRDRREIVEQIIIKEIARGRESVPERARATLRGQSSAGHKVYLRTR